MWSASHNGFPSHSSLDPSTPSTVEWFKVKKLVCLSAKSSWWLHALELALRSLKKRRGQRWGNGSMACSSCSWEVATSLGQAWPKFISETTWSPLRSSLPKILTELFSPRGALLQDSRALCIRSRWNTSRYRFSLFPTVNATWQNPQFGIARRKWQFGWDIRNPGQRFFFFSKFSLWRKACCRLEKIHAF